MWFFFLGILQAKRVGHHATLDLSSEKNYILLVGGFNPFENY